jgi:NADH-quinone oxidoreductase subunit C
VTAVPPAEVAGAPAGTTGTPAGAAEEGPERRAGALVTRSRGQEVLHPSRDAYHTTVEALRGDGFVMCADLTAVDYLLRPARDLPAGVAAERFEVVVNLLSLEPPRRVRLRVQVPEADPHVPTIWDLFAGADYFEREAYDLMGIVFDGHPDMTRIMMPEDWEGHPLRKDYPDTHVPVRFKGAPPTR